MNQLDLSRYAEAIGDLMRLDLVIDKDASSATQAYAQRLQLATDNLHIVSTHLPTSDLLPPIHFHGSSVQHNGAATNPSQSPASFVRGVVRLTADDPPQVRWTLVIRYGGEDRWRLEGVQVGGRGAKRGFFGVSELYSPRVTVLRNLGMDGCDEGGTLAERSSLVLEALMSWVACYDRCFIFVEDGLIFFAHWFQDYGSYSYPLRYHTSASAWRLHGGRLLGISLEESVEWRERDKQVFLVTIPYIPLLIKDISLTDV